MNTCAARARRSPRRLTIALAACGTKLAKLLGAQLVETSPRGVRAGFATSRLHSTREVGVKVFGKDGAKFQISVVPVRTRIAQPVGIDEYC